MALRLFLGCSAVDGGVDNSIDSLIVFVVREGEDVVCTRGKPFESNSLRSSDFFVFVEVEDETGKPFESNSLRLLSPDLTKYSSLTAGMSCLFLCG